MAEIGRPWRPNDPRWTRRTPGSHAAGTYEHLLERGAPAKPGLPFDQVYDLETLQPTPAWQASYEQVRREVASWGCSV